MQTKMNECFIRASRVAIAQHLQEVTITHAQFSPALKFILFGNLNFGNVNFGNISFGNRRFRNMLFGMAILGHRCTFLNLTDISKVDVSKIYTGYTYVRTLIAHVHFSDPIILYNIIYSYERYFGNHDFWKYRL